jgi:hypothetical protein
MEAQLLKAKVPSWWLRSLPAALGLIAVGIAGIAISLYLWSQFQRVPAGNWLAAVLCCLATLGMVIAAARSHSFKSAWGAMAVGITCTSVGFFWGLLGLFWFLLAAEAVAKFIAWLLRRERKP